MNSEKMKNVSICVLVLIVGLLLGKIWGTSNNSAPSANNSTEKPVKKSSGNSEVSPYEKNIVKPFLLKKAADPIQACYKDMIMKHPEAFAEGTIEISFAIQRDGKVKHANVTTNELKSKELEDCIVLHISQIEFPSPPGSEDYFLSHKFIFKKEVPKKP